MYLSLSSATFADLIAAARLVVPARASLPVLSGVLFHVDPATPRCLSTSATDLDLYLRKFHALAEPAVPGTLLLPFHKLAAIRPDKHSNVVIHQRSATAAAVTAICGGAPAVHHLSLLDAAAFPAAPSVTHDRFSETALPPETLAAITAARPFQSGDATRYVLNGCFLHPGGVVAADGRRLAMFICPGPPSGIILPSKACDLLTKLKARDVTLFLPRDDSPVATFRLGSGAIVHSTLIEGNYPNFRQVIPAASTRRLLFADPGPVIKFLRRLAAAPAVSGSAGSVTLTPLPAGRLELSHHQATLVTPAVCTPDMGQAAFNPAFLADCLEAVGPAFNQDDARRPALFSSPNALAVLMPMRVAEPAATAEPAEQPEAGVAAA